MVQSRGIGIVLAVIVALISYLWVSARSASANGPVVDLGYVKYTGTHKKADGSVAFYLQACYTLIFSVSLNGFYGIKYAQAPAGELRWRAPVPIDLNNNGLPRQLSATTRATGCPGGPQPAELNHMKIPRPANEDCLALDVVVPSSPVSGQLPVMVQIHGGGKFLDHRQTQVLVCFKVYVYTHSRLCGW
jgi:hypothetical protein